MTDKKPVKSPTRREFFKTAGLGTVDAAGAAAVGVTPKEAEATAPAVEGKGYRETAHVKRFYELATKF
jgi:hypothetical protein